LPAKSFFATAILKGQRVARHRTALIVNASPHKRSITTRFCRTFEKGFGSHYTKQIELHDKPPPHSDGTYNKVDTPWQRHVLESDVLFIGTPTYWFNVPSILKAFLDDLAAIDEEKLWASERFMVIAVHAPEGGEIGAVNALVLPLNMLGFTLPANGYVYYRYPADRWAWKDLIDVAERIRFA
jgi:multimeric flavodoxin WrbA